MPAIIFAADNLSVRSKGRMLLYELTLDAKAGEILTVLGRHGSGRETLRDVLAKQLPRDADTSGTLTLGGFGDGKEPRFAYLASPSLIALAPHATMESQLSRALARASGIPLKEAELAMRMSLERFSNTPTAAHLNLRPNAHSLRERALALLALGLAQKPNAVIADDIVSGLDPTEADEILDLLLKEQATSKFALIYFTGDPQVAVRLGGRVAVLRDGRLIEEGPAERMSGPRANAYTQSLFRAVPKLGKSTEGPRASPRSEPLLQVRSIVFDRPAKRTKPPEGITFDLRRGGSLALVGKRGSGRRSIMRAVLGMSRLYYGRIIFDAVDMGVLSPAMRARLRQRVAFISGEGGVLDPRMTVYETVIEPTRAHIAMGRAENLQTAEAMLKRVGLGDMTLKRRIASLSVLDRRRVQVARALAGGPQLVVLYEPLLGLDAPGQALVLDLLKDFRRNEGAAFVTITANFAVAEALAEDALIVRDRKIIERGPIAEILRAPKEPHTAALIAAVSPPEQALSQDGPQG